MKAFVLVVLAVAGAVQANVDWNSIQQRDVSPALRGGLPLFNTNKGNERVVGGVEVPPHSIPYQVGLIMTLNNGQNAFCGGSLISTKYVLTAAHCADGVRSIDVILGAHKINENEETQVRMTSNNFIIHPKWSSLLLHDDIALIVLPQEVELNENIKLVQLPSHSDESNHFTDAEATVSGWGKDKDSATGVSPVLRSVANSVMSNLKCMLSYPFVIRSSHLCVSGSGGKSSCSGDSGGPLTVSSNGVTKQVGLVSFGRADGCERGHPGVYTRLTSYLDWIQDNTGIQIN